LFFLPKIYLFFKGFIIKLCAFKNFLCLYLTFLKFNSSFLFTTLLDIVVLDFNIKFLVHYLLRSVFFNTLLHVVVQTATPFNLYSIFNLYSNALWAERECWDFFGLYFLNHLNLKRILTDYGFLYHPLLKTFPLIGITETFYSTYFMKLLNIKVSMELFKLNF